MGPVSARVRRRQPAVAGAVSAGGTWEGRGRSMSISLADQADYRVLAKRAAAARTVQQCSAAAGTGGQAGKRASHSARRSPGEPRAASPSSQPALKYSTSPPGGPVAPAQLLLQLLLPLPRHRARLLPRECVALSCTHPRHPNTHTYPHPSPPPPHTRLPPRTPHHGLLVLHRRAPVLPDGHGHKRLHPRHGRREHPQHCENKRRSSGGQQPRASPESSTDE